MRPAGCLQLGKWFQSGPQSAGVLTSQLVRARPPNFLPPAGFIAGGSGRPQGPLPDQVSASVVTIGERPPGVRMAEDASALARRAAALALVRSADPLPVSEAVMVSWARPVADCRVAGINKVVKLADSLIAAAPVEHDLPVVTRDFDYDQIARARPHRKVVKV